MQDQFSDLAGLRILVVENDPDNQILYTCLLESAGAAVRTATSVCEAFAILTQFTPDILISEIAIPNEDGYAFLRKLRALEADSGQFLPAIAVTAYIQGNDDLLALAAGFQKWLPKPIDLDHLINTIAQLVQHQQSGDRYSVEFTA
ncbi:MAG: response regulator [Leptolyngbyaceae cyanobacterium CAN_BIN12]|nr:response regulator [Leptolyngbyaceae cyanobacterium CAN_BIN12]